MMEGQAGAKAVDLCVIIWWPPGSVLRGLTLPLLVAWLSVKPSLNQVSPQRVSQLMPTKAWVPHYRMRDESVVMPEPCIVYLFNSKREY